MRHLLLVLLALGLPLAGGGGPPAPPDDDDATDEDDAADDDDASDDDDATDDDDAVETYTISGVLEADTGDSVEGVTVTFCEGAICQFNQATAAGDFEFGGTTLGTWVAHNIGFPDDGGDPMSGPLRWTPFYDIIDVEGDADLGTRTTLEVTNGATPASPMTFGDVTVEWSGALARPLNVISIDMADITLGMVDLDTYATWLDGEDVLAGVGFAPFEMGLEAGDFTVTIANTGASDGDAVSLVYAHYDEDINTGEMHSVAAEVVGGNVVGDVPVLSHIYVVAD